MKLVVIDWVDSSSVAGGHTWHGVETVKDDCNIEALMCRSVGWLLVDGRDAKTIIAHQAFGSTQHDLNAVSGDMTIPVCAIRKMKVLQK